MVAITVILAAVIAAFVFNLGGSQVKTPQASLTAVAASSTSSNITITHSGGDSIDLNKIKAIIEQGSYRLVINPMTNASTSVMVGDKFTINPFNNTAIYPMISVSNIGYANGATTGAKFQLVSGSLTITLIDVDSSQQIAYLKANVN
jgi:FlaG/FlaF family flagellin (archaellin)